MVKLDAMDINIKKLLHIQLYLNESRLMPFMGLTETPIPFVRSAAQA